MEAEGQGRRPPRRLTVVGVAAAAALVPLNSTMVAVALPHIADDFDMTAAGAGVLVTVYLVAMLLGQPVAGRLSDRVGSRRTAMVALVGFATASLAAAVAPSFGALVAIRGTQALFASALVPGVQSILRAVTPPEDRGRVFGLLGSVLGVGAAGGPVVGGALTQLQGWHAIFLVNVPIALAALAATIAVGQPPPSPASAATPVEAHSPLLNRVFVASFGVQASSTLTQYALLLITPIVLDAKGWSAGSSGLVLSALTVGMIVTGPWGGRVGDRRGRRAPVLAGLSLAAAAVLVVAVAGPSTSPALLIAVLATFGVGLGFATPSVMTAGLESVPERRTGTAGGVLSMSRYAGSIPISVAVSTLVAADAAGARSILVLGVAGMAGALLLAWHLPTRATRDRWPSEPTPTPAATTRPTVAGTGR